MQIVGSFLLLGCILSHKLLFIFFKLSLSIEESLLLVHRKDHILFALFLFHFVNSNHFVILLDHFIDNGIYISSFFLIFLHCLFSQLFTINHLLLNVLFKCKEVLLFFIGCLSCISIWFLLSMKHLNFNSCVLLLIVQKIGQKIKWWIYLRGPVVF